MIEALKNKGEDFSPDLMINAALHILSAWVASSQTTAATPSPAAAFGRRNWRSFNCGVAHPASACSRRGRQRFATKRIRW